MAVVIFYSFFVIFYTKKVLHISEKRNAQDLFAALLPKNNT